MAIILITFDGILKRIFTNLLRSCTRILDDLCKDLQDLCEIMKDLLRSMRIKGEVPWISHQVFKGPYMKIFKDASKIFTRDPQKREKT